MARIAFIGLGNMGLPMAVNLIKAGHQVEGVDVSPAAVAKLKDAGGTLPLSDKSPPEVISRLFGVSKGNFKKAIGALFKQGQIVIYPDKITLV